MKRPRRFSERGSLIIIFPFVVLVMVYLMHLVVAEYELRRSQVAAQAQSDAVSRRMVAP